MLLMEEDRVQKGNQLMRNEKNEEQREEKGKQEEIRRRVDGMIDDGHLFEDDLERRIETQQIEDEHEREETLHNSHTFPHSIQTARIDQIETTENHPHVEQFARDRRRGTDEGQAFTVRSLHTVVHLTDKEIQGGLKDQT